jgi:hypothetical protein
LEQAREDLIVSFSTTYYGIQVDAGDVVSVTNTDYGWASKLFRVMKVNEASLPDGSLGAKLELSEYNAQVYDDQNITQFTPIPNSNLTSPVYFSALSTPTVTGFPTASVPNISVQIFIPVTGRITFGNLFFTTNATPSPSDWKLLSSFSTSNSQPIGNNFNYTFTNLTIGSGTYYFAYLVGNENGQSVLSAASTAFVWSPISNTGPFVDISGFTAFTKLNTGVITPATATLTAITTNVTSPTYSWTITGATPASGASSSIVITPTAIATSVVATLVVNGSNLTSPVTRSVTMAIVNNGNNGNSARICFARVPSNPSPINGTITTSGNSTFPSSGQSLATWGFSATWGATDPNPSSTDSLYQSDGIYDPTTDATIWSTPYISSLKVGQLSAISANLGTITTGQITNTSAYTLMILGAAAGGASSGATMYFERTGSATSAVGPIIYGNDISTSKTSYSYAFASNVADTFLVYTAGLGIGSYNGVFQTANGSGTCFVNLSVQGYTEGPQLLVSQTQYNGTGGSPVNPAGDFVAYDNSLNQAARIKLASGTGYAYYIVTGVGGPFTGAHDALIAKTETIVQGDILVDVTLVRKATLSDTIFTVTKSTTPNQCALGVFNSGTEMFELAPPTALVEGYRTQVNPLGDNDYIPIPASQFYVYEPTHNQAIVNSIGEGQINVCGENGNIAVGDLIVTSSTAGKGMKQADDLVRSYTVAKAREAATFSSPTDIQMIACIYVSG